MRLLVLFWAAAIGLPQAAVSATIAVEETTQAFFYHYLQGPFLGASYDTYESFSNQGEGLTTPRSYSGFDLNTSDGDADEFLYADGNCYGACVKWSIGETLTLSNFEADTKAVSFILGRSQYSQGGYVTITATGESGSASTTFLVQTGPGDWVDNPLVIVGDLLGLTSITVTVASNLGGAVFARWHIDDVRTTTNPEYVPKGSLSTVPIPNSGTAFLAALGLFGLVRRKR